jgi:hypothetical protein
MPQSVQKIGNPISQREWFTFNAAGFSVPAGEEDGGRPETWSVSVWPAWCFESRFNLPAVSLRLLLESPAQGVAHPASLASFDSSREKLTAVMFFPS